MWLFDKRMNISGEYYLFGYLILQLNKPNLERIRLSDMNIPQLLSG